MLRTNPNLLLISMGDPQLTNVSDIHSLAELSASVAIFSAGILAFGLAARYLPFFEDTGEHA